VFIHDYFHLRLLRLPLIDALILTQ